MALIVLNRQAKALIVAAVAMSGRDKARKTKGVAYSPKKAQVITSYLYQLFCNHICASATSKGGKQLGLFTITRAAFNLAS